MVIFLFKLSDAKISKNKVFKIIFKYKERKKFELVFQVTACLAIFKRTRHAQAITDMDQLSWLMSAYTGYGGLAPSTAGTTSVSTGTYRSHSVSEPVCVCRSPLKIARNVVYFKNLGG